MAGCHRATLYARPILPVKVLAWMFSPTRRLMLMHSTGMGVFCYSQTDAYALDGHGRFRLFSDGSLCLEACDVFAYSAMEAYAFRHLLLLRLSGD